MRNIIFGCVFSFAATLFGAASPGGIVIPREPPLPVFTGKTDYTAIEKEYLAKAAAAVEAGETLGAVMAKPVFMDSALAWDIVHTAGATNLTALAVSSPKYAQFLSLFLADSEWMTLYSGAVLVPTDTAVGMRVMADIWARDFRSPDFRAFRSLGAGIATAWGAGRHSHSLQYGETFPPGDKHTDPVWRYYFFKQSQKSGLLQPGFMALRPWEIRFVAGNQWDDVSLVWLQKRVNVHPDLWGGACWVAPYTGTSEFGDTIQGPLFYAAAPQEMGEAERTYTYGGVCGALSTSGSTAACAHGYPSYTCGQPGHCAYAYRVKRGDWRGGFGGPDGGPHNFIFDGEAPTMPRLMEAAFADDAKVDRFVRLLATARVAEAIGGGSTNALLKQAWLTILKEAPLQLNAQFEFQQCVERNGLLPDGKWSSYGRIICRAYRGHGFALKKVLEPVSAKILSELTPDEKSQWFLLIQQSMSATPGSWATKISDELDRDSAALGKDDDAQEKFLTNALKVHLQSGNSQTFGQTLEWAIKKYVGNGKDDIFARAFMAANVAANGLSATNAVSTSKSANDEATKALRGAYGKAIVAAEKAKSLVAVQALSECAHRAGLDEGYSPNKKLTLPSGKLISAQGLLTLSSTSGYDRPCAHYKVLRDADGAFHTGSEAAPYAMIDLQMTYTISSIVIVKADDNEQRSEHLKLTYSVDGATWQPLIENAHTPREWLAKLPAPVDTRYIRVEQMNDAPEVFHLRNILVFTPEIK